jgi:hypothetical protein
VLHAGHRSGNFRLGPRNSRSQQHRYDEALVDRETEMALPVLRAVARVPAVKTSFEINQRSLSVNEQRKRVRNNRWARARMFRRCGWGLAEFRSDGINGVGSVVEGHCARAALGLDHFHR